jgi:HK97 family phage major capsid protein
MPQTSVEWRQDATSDELRERAKEMRSEWTELVNLGRDTDEFKAGRTAFLQEMEDIDVHLTLRSKAEGLDQLRQMGTPGVPAGALGVRGGEDVELRSNGAQVVESEAYADWVKAGRRDGRQFTHELRDLVAVNDINGSSNFMPVGQPYLVDTRRRRLFIRDLLGVQQTGLGDIPYIREKNVTANQTGASTVAEGGTKPEAKIEFEPDHAPVEVIAITLPLTVQIVEDAPTLMGYINGRLPYLLKFEEEDQVLRGDGVAPNLKGILAYAGVQAQPFVNDMAVSIGQGIAKIEVVDGFADGIAMNPVDFWAMMTHRLDQGTPGSGALDIGSIAQAPVQYVWGLPVVRTNSIVAGEALLGNYQLGATLFDRSQSAVRMFEQHADFAVKNKVLLRGEERIALAMNRADFFVKVDLTAA